MIIPRAMFSFTKTLRTDVKIGGSANIAMEIVLSCHALTVTASNIVGPGFEIIFQFCPTIQEAFGLRRFLYW